MKTIDEQLAKYKSVHFNPINLRTHFVGIPLIIASLLVFMSLLSINLNEPFRVTVCMLFVPTVLLYYARLHIKFALAMLLFILPLAYCADALAQEENAAVIALGVFVCGWLIQFIGHAYEKAKPAFVDDLNQLLIGPLFLIAEVFFICGREQALEKSVTTEARELRRRIEAERRKIAKNEA